MPHASDRDRPAGGEGAGWSAGVADGAWLDVSVPLREGIPHWPGETAYQCRVREADGVRTSELSLGTHTGTHVDAPLHFLPGAAGVDEAAPARLCGDAFVLRVLGPAVEAADIGRLPTGVRRVLLRTRNSDRAWAEGPHLEDHVGLTAEAARALAARRPSLVGIDYLSVAAPGAARPVHEALLGAGAWVLEGLDLRGVPEGPCELLCLPLRIEGGDGAPARAFVRPRAAA
ncbi:MAG TPA: cyclase family protein [Candidatus Thermoplasmatota archaeon]|nr:cyclase family protein [Candidatus Thermoplasmatota archaeon]